MDFVKAVNCDSRHSLKHNAMISKVQTRTVWDRASSETRYPTLAWFKIQRSSRFTSLISTSLCSPSSSIYSLTLKQAVTLKPIFPCHTSQVHFGHCKSEDWKFLSAYTHWSHFISKASQNMRIQVLHTLALAQMLYKMVRGSYHGLCQSFELWQ